MAAENRISCDTVGVTGEDLNETLDVLDGVTITRPVKYAKSKRSKNSRSYTTGAALNEPHGISFNLLATEEVLAILEKMRNSRKGLTLIISTLSESGARIYHFINVVFSEAFSFSSIDDNNIEVSLEGFPRVN